MGEYAQVADRFTPVTGVEVTIEDLDLLEDNEFTLWKFLRFTLGVPHIEASGYLAVAKKKTGPLYLRKRNHDAQLRLFRAHHQASVTPHDDADEQKVDFDPEQIVAETATS